MPLGKGGGSPDNTELLLTQAVAELTRIKTILLDILGK